MAVDKEELGVHYKYKILICKNSPFLKSNLFMRVLRLYFLRAVKAAEDFCQTESVFSLI